MREHILFDGNTIEIPIEHDGSSSEIKVMICWTDPAYQNTNNATTMDGGVPDSDVGPADDTTLRLINDVDLRVETPSGGTVTPWVLNPASPMAAATNGDNTRDNVEQVIISAPVAGTYVIEISHKGSLRAAEKLEPGDAGYDAQNPKFRLETAREQFVSVCVSGNKELPTDGLAAFPPIVAGASVLVEFQSLVGIRYQLEGSDDLDNWIDIGSPVDSTVNPQPLTVVRVAGEQKRFYRYREITPLAQ